MPCEPKIVDRGGQQVRLMVCDAGEACKPEVVEGKLYSCLEGLQAQPAYGPIDTALR